jgi:hypothetical protein
VGGLVLRDVVYCPPYIPYIHHASHTLCSAVYCWREEKTPVLTRRRSHAFSAMMYRLRHVNLERVDRNLKVSFMCAACTLTGFYTGVLRHGELQGRGGKYRLSWIR